MTPESLNVSAPTEDGDFELRVMDPGDPLVVKVIGPIDVDTSPYVANCLKAASGKLRRRGVILELADCPRMDSAGMGTLNQYRHQDRHQDIPLNPFVLVLANLSPRVARQFALTRLDKLFKIALTIDEARERFPMEN